MRPAYLDRLELTVLPSGSFGWVRRTVSVEGGIVGWVELVNRGTVSYWRIPGVNKAYASERDAAESLAVRVLDGPVAVATFEGERMKERLP